MKADKAAQWAFDREVHARITLADVKVDSLQTGVRGGRIINN